MNFLLQQEANRGSIPIENDADWDIDPADFSAWLEKWNLVSLILEAVQAVEWPESDLKLAASTGFTFRPMAMLTILTYSHATGVHSAKDIESMTHQDEVLRSFCTGSFPTAEGIRNFRRSHGELIRQTLAEAIRLAGKFQLRIPRVCLEACGRDHSYQITVPAEHGLELQSARAPKTRAWETMYSAVLAGNE